MMPSGGFGGGSLCLLIPTVLVARDMGEFGLLRSQFALGAVWLHAW